MIRIRHWLAAALLAASSLPALAGPEDARDLGDMAQDLLQATAAAHDNAIAAYGFDAPQMDAAFISGLQRFGVLASHIAVEMDQTGGPRDLGCIYRGMAEETDVQLRAISASKTGADQAAALERLQSMLDDSVMVSEAAAKALASASPGGNDGMIGSCDASPVTGIVTR